MPLGNLSQIKRNDLISKINEIRKFIENSKQDENTDNLLKYLRELEKDLNNCKYGLVFEEHREKIEDELENSIPILTENKDLFIDNGKTMNFLIEGDNLATLELLTKTHAGKIDVIYIDPPYNRRKNDFVYDDVFVDPNDSFKHSKWLSFMKSRLSLANHLLSENGSIFISIADEEMCDLKMLCDEIFGDNAFITCIPRIAKQQRSSQEHHMDVSHDYILCYSYSDDFSHIIDREIDETKVRTDHIGRYIINDTKAILADKSKGYSEGGDYDYEYNGKIYKPVDTNGVRNRWLWTKPRMDAAAKLGLLVETESSLRMQLYLDYKFDDKTNTMVPKDTKLIFHTSDFMTKGCYSNTQGSKELKEIDMNLFQKFNNPKPLSLIMDLIRLCDSKDIVILDFFGGSGTTGHAVMKLNSEDGGNRKFIVCTNNQNNICLDITYERLKKIIEKEKYASSLKYYKIGFVEVGEKFYYMYADELLKHIRELVELENGINFTDNSEITIVLSDTELDSILCGERLRSLKKIYLGHDVLMGKSQKEILSKYNIETIVVPNYYYKNEN